ncbi:hypothetical protein ACJX0J_007641, partial [Zea mays]
EDTNGFSIFILNYAFLMFLLSRADQFGVKGVGVDQNDIKRAIEQPTSEGNDLFVKVLMQGKRMANVLEAMAIDMEPVVERSFANSGSNKKAYMKKT